MFEFVDTPLRWSTIDWRRVVAGVFVLMNSDVENI